MRRGITLAAAWLAVASAATYYVATTGNDTNPGTLDRPWRKIGKAASTMGAGDSVLVRGGVYLESVNPAQSGTESDPITYACYDTESVFVDGSEAISGWVQDSGSRYRASVNFICDPRFTSVRDPSGNLGGLVIQNGAKLQYAMELSPAAVDSPGEYYMNDSLSPPFMLYANLRDLGAGFDPNNYEMRIGRRRKGFDLDGGEDWLVVIGITFRNHNDNAIHSVGATDCEFRELTLHTNFITGIYLTSNSNRCLIEKCSFWDNGHAGIELASSRRNVVRKSRFLKRDLGDGCGGNGAHMWLGPVSQFADSNLIENNVAFGTGRYGYRGPFAGIAGSYNIIRHNSMVDDGGGAIALLDGGHNTIVNNACDMSASVAHGLAVFPNACRDSFQFFKGNCFYAENPTDKYWWDNVRYSSLVQWESAGAQVGNIDSLPGFLSPDSEDLHLVPGSACIDHGTPDSAAVEDFGGVLRPQGAGFDIGAFEYVGVDVGEETMDDGRGTMNSATIIRGVLLLGDRPRTATAPKAVLLDACGREVLGLRAGANDVRSLAPGVYFIRSDGSRKGSFGACGGKVVVQR
jgi:parallel beta-helix repeat protein